MARCRCPFSLGEVTLNHCPFFTLRKKPYFPIQRPSFSLNAAKNLNYLPFKDMKRRLTAASISSETFPVKNAIHSDERKGPHTTKESPYFTSVGALQSYQNDFYDVPCVSLARNLLGKILVRQLDDGVVLRSRIVETECYLGGDDKASHSCNGRKTERNSPMFMKPGTAYVYLTYGMYHCFNISSQGDGAAVLLRAVEPLQGIEFMNEKRAQGVKKNSPSTGKKKQPLKLQELCNGPSKLCIALDINRDNCNKRDLTTWPGLALEPDLNAPHHGDIPDCRIVVTKRIGIESAGPEWANKPLRFYVLGSSFVSRRDRQKEKELQDAHLTS